MLREISGVKDEAYQYALKLIKQGARDAERKYLIENSGMIRQALASPSKVSMVLAVPEEARALKALCEEAKTPVYSIRPGVLQKLVGTNYETGVTSIAVVEQRTVTVAELLKKEGDFAESLLLSGENIQDPRNVGVLVRTAEAAGCGALILSSDSAEPFSRAAVRSTTGSILRLPICLVPNLAELLAQLAGAGFTVAASSASATQLAYDAKLSRRPLCIAVGNETSGMTEAARASATDFVRLPMSPNGASSLNVTVAAGVLLYEAVRQKSG